MMAKERIIMHVDMDAFYASVEIARAPELRDRPMYVGGAGRGVVLSANYPARAFGISAGMPASRARRLCPQAVVIPPDLDRYAQVSSAVFAIFTTVTDRVEAASVDEAFLDVTGATRRLGEARLIAEMLRAQIADEQRITCSVGIGPNKLVAKMASSQAKPDGLLEVGSAEILSFLHPLPVSAIWGVGAATEGRLHRLGLRTVDDLAHTPKATLRRALGDGTGNWLADLAWGTDERQVSVWEPEQSIGAQETFGRDTDDPRQIKTELLRLSARVSARLRSAELCASSVTISVRFADFSTIQKSGKLASPTDVTDEIYAKADRLYAALNLQRARVRRVGVRAEELVPAAQSYLQPTLDAPERGMREAERAADLAVLKFGPRAVQRASLTGS